MSEAGDAQAGRLAQLEGRVEALEQALAARSRQLRLLQRHLCKRDLVILSRIAADLPPLPLHAYDPALWEETTALVRAEVDETLLDLWASLPPREPTCDD